MVDSVIIAVLGCPCARPLLLPDCQAVWYSPLASAHGPHLRVVSYSLLSLPASLRPSRISRYLTEADYVLLAVCCDGKCNSERSQEWRLLQSQALLARTLGCAGVVVVPACNDPDHPHAPTHVAEITGLLVQCGFAESAVLWANRHEWVSSQWLRTLPTPALDPTPPARLAIAHRMPHYAAGVRVRGRVWGGAIKPGDLVTAAPSFDGNTITGRITDGSRATCGSLADFGIGRSGTLRHLRKGMLLGLIKDAPPVNARAISGPLTVVSAGVPGHEADDPLPSVYEGQSVLCCAHVARVTARVAAIMGPRHEERRTKLLPGESAGVILVFARRSVMETAAEYPRLGGFSLFSDGLLLATGTITTVWYVFPDWQPRYLAVYPPRYQQLAVTLFLSLRRLPSEVISLILRCVSPYLYEGQRPWRGCWHPAMGHLRWWRNTQRRRDPYRPPALPQGEPRHPAAHPRPMKPQTTGPTGLFAS